MKYLSVCSGIEAASVAWDSLGWEPVAFSEIEPFPSAVLAERFLDVPNLGDMTKYHEWNIPAIDLMVGGTPCQAFSVAGKRVHVTLHVICASVMLKAAYSTVRTGRVKKNMGISGSRKPGRKNKMIDAISNMLGMALIFTIAYLSYLIGRQDAGKNEKRKK